MEQLFKDPNYSDSKAASYLINQLAITAVFQMANSHQNEKLFEYVQNSPDVTNSIPFALIALGYEKTIKEIESNLWKTYAQAVKEASTEISDLATQEKETKK